MDEESLSINEPKIMPVSTSYSYFNRGDTPSSDIKSGSFIRTPDRVININVNIKKTPRITRVNIIRSYSEKKCFSVTHVPYRNQKAVYGGMGIRINIMGSSGIQTLQKDENIFTIQEEIVYKIKHKLFNTKRVPKLCDLSNQQLTYTNLDQTRFRIVDFSVLNVHAIFNERASTVKLMIDNCKKPIEFYIPTKFIQWQSSINMAINSSRFSLRKNPRFPLIDHKFLQHQIINIKAIEKCADSGDILLLKSKGFNAYTQRMISGCQFDHIALVIKTCENELLLLESSNKVVWLLNRGYQLTNLMNLTILLHIRWSLIVN